MGSGRDKFSEEIGRRFKEVRKICGKPQEAFYVNKHRVGKIEDGRIHLTVVELLHMVNDGKLSAAAALYVTTLQEVSTTESLAKVQKIKKEVLELEELLNIY